MILNYRFRGNRVPNGSKANAIKSSKAQVAKKPVTLPKLKCLEKTAEDEKEAK